MDRDLGVGTKDPGHPFCFRIMTPDSHPVFNETRLVHWVIKLEQELGTLREINESQQDTINWLKVDLEKRGEVSRARGRTMAFIAFEQKRVREVLHQTLTKFRKTRKHLGLLTNQTTKKLAAIKCRLDNLEIRCRT